MFDLAALFKWLPNAGFIPFVSVGILGAALGSDVLMDFVGLNGFRSWLGLVFLVALVIMFAQLIDLVWHRLQARCANDAIGHRLRNMTAEEQAFVGRYIERGSRSQYLDVGSGVVAELVRVGILYRADSGKTPGIANDRWPFNLSDAAWAYLDKHPKIAGVIRGVAADRSKKETQN